MDSKKGLKNGDSLELKVQAIRNRVEQVMTSWSASVFAEMRAALERDRASLALSEAHDRTPAHPEDISFDDAPPLYEESEPLGELPIQGPMLNASLNSDGHLALTHTAPLNVRNRLASAYTARTTSGVPPEPPRAQPSTPAYAGYAERVAQSSHTQPPMPGPYPTRDHMPMQHRASAPAVPTQNVAEPPTRNVSASVAAPSVRSMTLNDVPSFQARQRQGTRDSIASSSTVTSPASLSPPLQQSSFFSPTQRTSTVSSTGSSQPQSPSIHPPPFLSPDRRNSTVSSISSGHSNALSSAPKRAKTLADLANDNSISWNPPLNRTISGIPCRSNNYWGLCKGAWAIASAEPKALGIAHVPLGMHSFRRFIYCKACNFQGKHCSDSAKVPVPDRSVYTHPATGVRFRWAFLAKSHLKCKDDSLGNGFTLFKQRYGCLFCIEAGRWPPTLEGVDALMYHILRFHTGEAGSTEGAAGNEVMPEWVKRKNLVVLGRMALPEETFDLNIPMGYEEKLKAETRAAEGGEEEVVEMGDGTPLPRELQA